MSDILISVIVPAYQAEKTLDRCLKSIVSQSYHNYELLIINDGSTDRTAEICENYANMYSHIRYYSQENIGISETRQKAVSLARGKYIQFVDADDWADSHMLQVLSDKVKEYEYDIIISDFIIETKHKSLYKKQEPSALYSRALIADISSPRLAGVMWNKLIKKDLFDNVSFPNGIHYCEDWIVCFHLFERTNNVFYLNKAFYHYDIVTNPNSLVRKLNSESFIARMDYINYLKAISFNIIYHKEYDSQVASNLYYAIIYKCLAPIEIKRMLDDINVIDNYNSLYKRIILFIAKYISIGFSATTDRIARICFHTISKY